MFVCWCTLGSTSHGRRFRTLHLHWNGPKTWNGQLTVGALWPFHHLHLQRNVRQICIIISKKGSKEKTDSFFPMNIVKTISYNIYNRKSDCCTNIWCIISIVLKLSQFESQELELHSFNDVHLGWDSLPAAKPATAGLPCSYIQKQLTFQAHTRKYMHMYVTYMHVFMYIYIYIYIYMAWYILMTSQIQLWYGSPLLPCEAKIYPTHLANWLSLSWILQFSCERFSPLHIKPRESRSTFYN